jgi:hypothetical protein
MLVLPRKVRSTVVKRLSIAALFGAKPIIFVKLLTQSRPVRLEMIVPGLVWITNAAVTTRLVANPAKLLLVM